MSVSLAPWESLRPPFASRRPHPSAVMADDLGDGYTEKSRDRLVAIYDFDPSTIDWPFRRQRPLPLTVGQVVHVVHDDGGEWALGHPVDDKDNKGYFPRNYTVTVAEYNEMMRDYEEAEAPAEPLDDPFQEDPPHPGPPQSRALPESQLPEPMRASDNYTEAMQETEFEDPELIYKGLKKYPALECQPPINTTYDMARSRLLREMPPIPDPAPEEPAPPRSDIEAARRQLERELEEIENADLSKLKGGKLSHTRPSTPATYAVTRPERDFIRSHLPDNHQGESFRDPMHVADLVRRQVRLSYDEPTPYTTDLRVRATTTRLARHIEPAHMKIALNRATGNGAKWTQLFRPGFRDLVNESFKVGCNACLLSELYCKDQETREQFQKLYALDVKGTFWNDLQRRKGHLFYMRMDYFDVMMCHPDAWGFPDTSRIVSANAGEAINPFHGWFAQHSINPDRELEDVEFTYSLRLRCFPEQTFQALSLGKIPDWVAPYLTLHAEAQPELDPRDDEADAGPAAGKSINVDNNLLMEAGLEESDDLYVRLDELRLAKERTAAPDVLEIKPMSYRLTGLSAMRIFLRSRGNPDNMKQTLISPKMVKDMAAQLGIRDDHARYWYCLFALRYPMSPEWEVVVRNDTRWYLHLPSDRLQPVHPMIRKFREHLDDCKSNEFLWDYRGFVRMKCSECGLPDSVIWCHQCTDNFCAPCYLKLHKSKRGKKHWPMPVPGCRYLTGAEAGRLGAFLPLLNAGFSNRRRFLARDNQSDKNGSRTGDTWLFFHADTFHAALQQSPEKHWYLKRLKPPRLKPGAEGYYYNFANDVLADDESHIMTKAEQQKAVSVIQKAMRGALTRRAIRRQTQAAVVIQKTKMMWDVQKVHGSNGKNCEILKSWYRKYKAKEEKKRCLLLLAKVQARWRGVMTRKMVKIMLRDLTRFQAAFRGQLGRRKVRKLRDALAKIQRVWRGWIRGRRVLQQRNDATAAYQALFRGVKLRRLYRQQVQGATRIQARYRGKLARKHTAHLNHVATMLQRNWRRFQGQITMKQLIYEKVEDMRVKRLQVLREKLEDGAASLFQRNWWRHRDYERFATMKRAKGEADKRTSTMLVALYSSAANLRNFVHPWWRHLPKETQDVLQSIKVPLQRAIAQTPLTGKLANEELGRRPLRCPRAEDLVYTQTGKEPDLASHLLLSVTRHLLAHVPVEDFPDTVRWGCYAVAHQAVDFYKTNGYFHKEEIPVGKELPPHPGDKLSTLYKDLAVIQSRNDRQINLCNESLQCLILKRLPTHQRQVFLTAEVLVTMRQALDTPSLSTEDHLRFQGVDASAGAQLMEVLGSELDHRLPLDWPKLHGTVAALAAQASTHMSELKMEKDIISLKKKKVKKEKQGAPPDADVTQKLFAEGDGMLAHFNRAAAMRILQQVGYFMCDQDRIMQAVLKTGGGLDDDFDMSRPLSPAKGSGAQDKGKSEGVRQSRFVAVADRLFELAEHEKHDHCSFVLAVVMYHMVMRGLMLRVLYHRAAICIQKRYRYLKTGSKRREAVAPAICIQRFYRGLATRLRLMRQDDAAFKLQRNYRAWRWSSRARRLVRGTLFMQRVWKGWIVRSWLRKCHTSATLIQKTFRRMLVRLVMNEKGRALMRQLQEEISQVTRQQSEMSISLYIAKTAQMVGKAKVAVSKFREQNVNVRRAHSFSVKSAVARKLDKQKKLKLKGSVQPVRVSMFEPMFIARRRIAEAAAQQAAASAGAKAGGYGARQSKVGQAVRQHRAKLERHLGLSEGFAARDAVPSHAASRAGRRALFARQVAKAPKLSASAKPESLVDDSAFSKWMAATLVGK